MALLHEKPTVCKECQSRSISRKKRPFWLKLVTSSKRLYCCDICGWTVWVQRNAASAATRDSVTEFPNTIVQSTAVENTRPFVPEILGATPLTVGSQAAPAAAQPAAQSSARRHAQGELSLDSD